MVFDVTYVIDSRRGYLVAYYLKNVARNWFKKLKEGRDEDAPLSNCACFEEAFLGCFFLLGLKEAKVKSPYTKIGPFECE